MITIYAVTHTQSVHHVEKLGGGWYDTPLTQTGREQAGAIAGFLMREIGEKPVDIYTSDLKRAAETAEIIGHTFNTIVTPEPGLREMNFGEAGGKDKAWQEARIDPHPADGNMLDHLLFTGSESRRDVGTRVSKALNGIITGSAVENIILVTHGYALTFLIMAWLKVPVEHMDWCFFHAKSGSITKLYQDDHFKSRAVEYVARTV